MRATEKVVLASGNVTGNQSASPIFGGSYALETTATNIDGNHTSQLQIQAPGGTWLNVGNVTTAAGLSVVQLPPGQVRVSISGNMTAADINLVSVPLN